MQKIFWHDNDFEIYVVTAIEMTKTGKALGRVIRNMTFPPAIPDTS